MKLRIKELAKERGFTITFLSEKAGITQATLSNTVNGKSEPSFEVLKKVSAALEVEIWELFISSTERESIDREVNGYLEVKGVIYKVSSKKDIEDIIIRL